MELLRIISVGFDIADQLLIRLFAFVRCRRNWYLAYDSFRREVLCSILIDFGGTHANSWAD
jgi:hypothetical protein